MVRRREPLPPGFGTIWSCVALDLLGFGIVLPILPVYARRFHASPVTATALIAVFSAAQLVCSPLLGRLSDRVGRKPVLILSLAGTAVGSLLTGLAGSVAVLYLGRLVDGASGASVAAAQAAVSDVAAPAQRARLFGLLGAAFGLGFVGGPALAGVAAAIGGPRLPFYLAAGLAGINALTGTRRLPETRRRSAPSAPADPETGASARRAAPLIGLAFVALVAFSGFEATFSLFGKQRLDFTLATTGLVFALIGIGIAIVQAGLIHPIVGRLGDTGAIRAGLVANAAGLAVLAAVHGYGLLAPALLFLVVGQGVLTPSLAAAVVGRVGAERRGEVLGWQQAAGSLARVVGPLTAGVLFQLVGVSAPFLAGAAVLVAAVLILTPGETRHRMLAG
jgi:MFS family permease